LDTPACAETLHQRIPGSRLVIFEHSEHLGHVEKPQQYRHVVADFMAEIEAWQL
jgi:pimeloyl-ACP methyl ester carboxylesterase